MEISEIKEEVYKCSKCGLCQSVCPLYLATKNEMFLPRGRYIVLNNFFNNGKKLTKSFIKNLDICLNCNACKKFCPSNIDTVDILTNLKSMNNFKFKLFDFSFYYFLYMNFQRFFKPEVLVKRKKRIVKKANEEKVVYFQGCVNKHINPSDKNATLNILDQIGYDVVSISNHCCGLPYLSDGNLNKFELNAKKILKSLPKDFKYIVCSCDSCFNTLSKIKELSDKLVHIDDILKMNYIDIPSYLNTVYYKPMIRNNEVYKPEIMPVINKKGTCSLMENFYIFKYPKLTKLLLNTVFFKKEELENKYIITSCNLSKLGIEKGIKELKSNAKVITYAEYVASTRDFL